MGHSRMFQRHRHLMFHAQVFCLYLQELFLKEYALLYMDGMNYSRTTEIFHLSLTRAYITIVYIFLSLPPLILGSGGLYDSRSKADCTIAWTCCSWPRSSLSSHPVYELEQYSWVWNVLSPELKEVYQALYFFHMVGNAKYNNLSFTLEVIS